MKIPISVRNVVNVCCNVTIKRQPTTKQEILRKLFASYVKEHVIILTSSKHLPDLMEKIDAMGEKRENKSKRQRLPADSKKEWLDT